MTVSQSSQGTSDHFKGKTKTRLSDAQEASKILRE